MISVFSNIDKKEIRFQTLLLFCVLLAEFFVITTPLLAASPTLSAPTLYWSTTNEKSSAVTDTAILGATIDSGGGETLSERGIVWSTSDNTPQIGEPGVTKATIAGTAIGVFSGTITGLTPASLIYFQGYATNPSGTSYSGVSSFYTEFDPETVTGTSGISYFEFTVDFPVPDSDIVGADAGVVVVIRQTMDIATPPFDGTTYTPNARIGLADTTDPSCPFYCEAVVADEPAVSGGATGSVTITGLKEGFPYYVAVFTYKGTGSGISGINYNQSISSTGPITTASVPAAGTSHNELYVAQAGAGGTMTDADCGSCHTGHHQDQLLPRDLDQYNKCWSCHNPTTPDPRTGVLANSNIGLHLNPTYENPPGSPIPVVDCGTCHSLHSWRTEELYSVDEQGNTDWNLKFIRKNMAKYLNTTDGYPVDANEPTFYQVTPDDFAIDPAVPPPSYNAVCQTCHSLVDHHTQTATDGHKIGQVCTGCHPHQADPADQYNAFFPSGGHSATDFAWNATTQTSCGTTDCHDYQTNSDVVEQVHNGRFAASLTTKCKNCHDNDGGGSGTTWLGPTDGDGDATNAGSDTTVACTVCHTKTKTAIHHETTLDTFVAAAQTAQNGYCQNCHIANVGEVTTPQTRANGLLNMPPNLPCNFCHLYFPNSGYVKNGTKVQIFRLTFDPNISNNGTGLSITPLGSHEISEVVNPPIQDYSACFACHGASGNGGTYNGRADEPGVADMVRPFHGLGAPYEGDDWLTGGDASDYINQFMAPQNTGCNQPIRNQLYHPGPNAFNSLGPKAGPDPTSNPNSIRYQGYTSNKNYNDSGSGDSGYCAGQPHFHDNDDGDKIRVNATYYSSGHFEVPWDDYADAVVAPGSGSITVDTGSDAVFPDQTASPAIPLVPLTIP